MSGEVEPERWMRFAWHAAALVLRRFPALTHMRGDIEGSALEALALARSRGKGPTCDAHAMQIAKNGAWNAVRDEVGRNGEKISRLYPLDFDHLPEAAEPDDDGQQERWIDLQRAISAWNPTSVKNPVRFRMIARLLMLGCTHREIGIAFGVSESRVTQIAAKFAAYARTSAHVQRD